VGHNSVCYKKYQTWYAINPCDGNDNRVMKLYAKIKSIFSSEVFIDRFKVMRIRGASIICSYSSTVDVYGGAVYLLNYSEPMVHPCLSYLFPAV
jgi:hypothetical protein